MSADSYRATVVAFKLTLPASHVFDTSLTVTLARAGSTSAPDSLVDSTVVR